MQRKALPALGAIVFLLALWPATSAANMPRIGQDNGVAVQGGDTSASSGDATGGNGGDANAYGGDGNAGNTAIVDTGNTATGTSPEQSNNTPITQGGNTATGGDGKAYGGDGGDANSGNTQIGNGNSADV